MNCFDENDRRNRLMILDTLRRAVQPTMNMSEDAQAWCRIQQRVIQREITILSNWKQFSYDEQCEYAWEFDREDAAVNRETRRLIDEGLRNYEA